MDIWGGGFEVPLEGERRIVGILYRIICSIGCLDIAADTHELFVHVAPVVGGIDVGLGVGEVPCLFDGLDDDVLLLFPDQVKGLVFLKARVVAVHVGVDRGDIPFGVGKEGGLQHTAVASAVESVYEMVFLFDEEGERDLNLGVSVTSEDRCYVTV